MSVKVVVLVVVLAAVLSAAESTVTCQFMYQKLFPCMAYLTNEQMTVPPQVCCTGIRQMLAAAQTGADRRTACGCLKTVARNPAVTPPQVQKAGALPDKCGVPMPYKISPSTDCAKVN